MLGIGIVRWASNTKRLKMSKERNLVAVSSVMPNRMAGAEYTIMTITRNSPEGCGGVNR